MAAKPRASTHVDPRRTARLAALQALYQVTLGETTADAVTLEFLQHRLDEEIDGLRLGKIDRALFRQLVRDTHADSKRLDELLTGVLPAAWPVDRLEMLLRLILRLGAYELLEQPSTPARVVITEYLELAKAFFDDREPKMVNAILDRLGRQLRPEEFSGGDGGTEPPLTLD